MSGVFTGKDTVLLNEQQADREVRIWQLNLEKEEIGHMACCMEEYMYFICVQAGDVTLQINQNSERLFAGEGMFINKGQVWRYLESSRGCKSILVEFETKLMDGFGDEILESSVRPVVGNENFPGLKLTGSTGEQERILSLLERIRTAAMQKNPCFEMEIRGFLYEMWTCLYREFLHISPEIKKSAIREAQKLQTMIAFLHRHYREKITLAQMAESTGVSTGEYCRFFKKHINKTPVEYLQVYRIEKSLPQLLNKEGNMSEIAAQHGFTGASYYAETFKKEMGCAPGDYRKWYIGEFVRVCPLKAKETGEEQIQKEQKVTVQRRQREAMPAHLL